MKFSHIVAMSENRVIGVKGDLPWHIPADLKFFKEKTENHIVIMGRKTFESFPGSLPRRLNIIVTRKGDYDPGEKNCLVAQSLEEAMKLAEDNIDNYSPEVFIAGGGEIYRQSIEKVDNIYLTVIHKSYEGDTQYPEFDSTQFKETERKDYETPCSFSFITLEKL